MTHGEQEHMDQQQRQSVEPVERSRVVVVAVDAERLSLYLTTFRMAGVPTSSTLDADEAEAFVLGHRPAVLVLDHGLPRMVIFRLYGLVRDEVDEPRVKVLFVGQDGATGPDDHYLPGEPSPLTVAAQAGKLVAEADAEAASAAEVEVEALPDTPERSSFEAVDETEVANATGPAPTEADDGDADATGVADGSRPPVADAAPAAAAARGPHVSEPRPEPKPRVASGRLGVIAFRVGLVLLILGGILLFLSPESFAPFLSSPPTADPVTPTPAPGASPSPAALFEDAVLHLGPVSRAR